MAWRRGGSETDGDLKEKVNVERCADCGCLSGLRWAGWRAVRVEDLCEPPALAFYCPACAEDRFGPRA